MTRAVIFRTPGLIPIEAFTHFGVNAKPNSTNPIGFFGTGLKYAIAVLVREGLTPVVWIGNKKYVFFAKDRDFRGKEFTFIRMKRETWQFGDIVSKSYFDLPFTTELGKNWQLWQAFRELETNTRDEAGDTSIRLSGEETHAINETLIIVEGEKFVEEFVNMNRTFLDPKLIVGWENERLQVFDRPSEFVYYRGINVYKLEKLSKFTYNILGQMTLTEDRTLAYPHLVEQEVGKFAALSEDGSLIKRTVEKDDKHWEGSMNWAYIYNSPGKKFLQVMSSRSSRWASSSSAGSYYRGYAPKPTKVDPLKAFPRPWEVEVFCGRNNAEERHNQVVDAKGKVIFDSSNSEHREMDYEVDEDGGTWRDIGTYGLFKYIVDMVNKQAEDEEISY